MVSSVILRCLALITALVVVPVSGFYQPVGPAQHHHRSTTTTNRHRNMLIGANNGMTEPVPQHKNGVTVPLSATATAVMNKVRVEHGRGQWETYGDLDSFQKGKYQIKCLNKISPVGLGRLDSSKYDIRLDGETAENAHAILLRSHKLSEQDVPQTCRAIARAGAGVNNIDVERMSEIGIPVFNTPGANANAVKELVFCGMFLASRGIVQGIQHMKRLAQVDQAKERVEKDKAMFAGREIKGKTLAVIGLGNIGAIVAQDAADGLGMNIVGYDPYLSVENAMKLPREIKLAETIQEAVADADYISIHIPYSKGTHQIISRDIIDNFKDDAVLLNFARGELVDSAAMKDFLDRRGAGQGRYVSDFHDDLLWDHENMMILPHLGASTTEAEDAAASMAVDTLRDYLESGTIKNSVNFPSLTLSNRAENTVRFTVISHDAPGVLGHIFEIFGDAGLNILQEVAKTRGVVSYTVLDVDTTNHSQIEFKKVQEQITMLPGVKSSRVLYGMPGAGYAKNLEGEYFV